ncbi:hypothetical protein M752DRAFT_59694 [Aspergillus phoenicis ATCC 13157]|uniref:Uncharacterized protein n=1 Tax=Aspergillus phoenicis ATCC 13157 TaxID=1353007 RepID=A0A370PA91_ASPPH|nr:hypothetical protein M752DRAFT_59694 [Aspergillus phoenicis ATCC 13157]
MVFLSPRCLSSSSLHWFWARPHWALLSRTKCRHDEGGLRTGRYTYSFYPACRFEGRRARTSDVCMYHSIGKAKCGMNNFKSRKSNAETCRVMGSN